MVYCGIKEIIVYNIVDMFVCIIVLLMCGDSDFVRVVGKCRCDISYDCFLVNKCIVLLLV